MQTVYIDIVWSICNTDLVSGWVWLRCINTESDQQRFGNVNVTYPYRVALTTSVIWATVKFDILIMNRLTQGPIAVRVYGPAWASGRVHVRVGVGEGCLCR